MDLKPKARLEYLSVYQVENVKPTGEGGGEDLQVLECELVGGDQAGTCTWEASRSSPRRRLRRKPGR